MQAQAEQLNNHKADFGFEQYYKPYFDTDTLLELGSICIRYAQVERVPRYDSETRENDAEHSNMLAIISPELAESLRPGQLDLGLISQFAAVHDLLEIVTGDVPTFHTSEGMIAQKRHDERLALPEVISLLPPHTARIFQRYEALDTPEAWWVKACDKILPLIVDIRGEGVQIMKEDYGVHTTHELIMCHDKLLESFIRRFGETCPELIPLYRDLLGEFARVFDEAV